MSQQILAHVASVSKRQVPTLRPGYTVRVHQIIKEGDKQRTQIFEGLVMRLNAGADVDKTFTVRKMVQGIGVEKIFPLHSPIIEKIEVVKQGKVRRAKLYFMRNLAGKGARLRESQLELVQAMGATPTAEEEPKVEEAPKAEGKEAA